MRILLTNVACDAGAAAARSLARAGYHVIGADVHPLTRWSRSRYLHAYHALPSGDVEAMGRGLVAILERHPCDVLLTVGTNFLRAALGQRARLAGLAATNLPSDAAFATAYDKRACMAACVRVGVPCAAALAEAEATARLAGPDGLGVVVKPAHDVGRSDGLTYVHTTDALRDAILTCDAQHGPVVIQELIPGPPASMRALTVLYDAAGRFVAGFALEKRRQHPASGGITVTGRTIPMEPLLALVQPFFEAVGWTGPAEVEFKLDARDGIAKVIEINPRFPGYLRFPVAMGVDFPRLAVDTARGRATGTPAGYRAGALHLAPTMFVQSLREEARTHGWLATLPGGLADLVRASPRLVGMLRDPLPALARSRRP